MKNNFKITNSYSDLTISEIVETTCSESSFLTLLAFIFVAFFGILFSLESLGVLQIGIFLVAIVVAIFLSAWALLRIRSSSISAQIQIHTAQGVMKIGVLDERSNFSERLNLKISNVESIFLHRNRRYSELKIRMKENGEIFTALRGNNESLEPILHLMFATMRVSDQRHKARSTRTARFLEARFS